MDQNPIAGAPPTEQPVIGTGLEQHGAAAGIDTSREGADTFNSMDDDEYDLEMMQQLTAAVKGGQQQQQYFQADAAQTAQPTLPAPAPEAVIPDALPRPDDARQHPGSLRIKIVTPEDAAALLYVQEQARLGNPVKHLIRTPEETPAAPAAAQIPDAPAAAPAVPAFQEITTQIAALEAALSEAQTKRDERNAMMDSDGFATHQRVVDKTVMDLAALKARLTFEQANAAQVQAQQQAQAEEQAKAAEYNAVLAKYPSLADDNHPFTRGVTAAFWNLVDQGMMNENDPKGIAKAVQIVEAAGVSVPAAQSTQQIQSPAVTRYSPGPVGGSSFRAQPPVAEPSLEDVESMSPAEFQAWQQSTSARVMAMRTPQGARV